MPQQPAEPRLSDWTHCFELYWAAGGRGLPCTLGVSQTDALVNTSTWRWRWIYEHVDTLGDEVDRSEQLEWFRSRDCLEGSHARAAENVSSSGREF